MQKLLILILAAALLPACQAIENLGRKPTTRILYTEDNTPIIKLDYDAGDKLASLLSGRHPKQSPLTVIRFANRLDPDDGAPFGEVVAEQVSTRLTQRGFLVTDTAADMGLVEAAKARLKQIKESSGEEQKTFLKEEGDNPTPRPASLIGTYTIGQDVIYLSAKVVRLDDQTVLAAYDWTLPQNQNTRELLPQLKSMDIKPSVKTGFR